MDNCKECGKELIKKRNTKQFCNTSCSARYSIKHKSMSSAYLYEPLFIEEGIQILNYYYAEEREVLRQMTILEFLNILFQKTEATVVFDKEKGFYVAE
jgi:hypothetical protein